MSINYCIVLSLSIPSPRLYLWKIQAGEIDFEIGPKFSETHGFQGIILCPSIRSGAIIFILGKGNSTLEPKAQMAGAYLGFLIMKHAQEYCCSSLDGKIVHHRVTPQQYVSGTHTPGWRGIKWSKVSRLTKRRNRWGMNPRPPDLECEVLTTLPHMPLHFHLSFGLNFIFLSLGIWLWLILSLKQRKIKFKHEV